MPSGRRFHRSVIELEILTAAPLSPDADAGDIAWMILEGPSSSAGRLEVQRTEEVDAAAAVAILRSHGVDPATFNLDEAGNDME